MNNKLLVANWKLNPLSQKKAVDLAKKIDFKNVVVAPPFPFIEEVSKVLRNADTGAQDVFWEEKGADTGEVSPAMLKSVGVKYVILGHSERRRILKETDEMINKKVKEAIKAGLKVILCVGEPKRDLKNKIYDLRKAKKYIQNQLESDLKNILNRKSYLSLIVAYEPIWAIGTGCNDAPADAVKIIKFIKEILSSKFHILDSKVLYGGSVNAENIADYMKYKEIYGALVGGASLNATEFKKMIEIVFKA